MRTSKRNVDSEYIRHPLRDKLYLNFIAGWYSKSDPTARDRCRHLSISYSSSIAANLVGGTFWSGLLLLLNADDGLIGTLSMIATAANLLQIFAPILLERFPRRRTLLTIMRALMYFFQILVIGLIPMLPLGQQGKMVMLVLSVLTYNLISAFSVPGINIWHIQSIPDRVRKNYFSLITMTNGTIVAIFNLIGSRIVDWLSAYGMEYQGLLALRLFALALATYEIFIYLRITEYPYEKSDSSFRIRDLFILPFSNKKYLLNVACVMLWNFSAGIPGSYHSIYMLRDVGASYSYIMLVSLLCTLVSFCIAPLWNKILRRVNWFQLLSIAMPLYVISYAGFAFTSKATIYLYALASLIGSIGGVGVNLAFSGIPYYNMPAQHSTVYISFYSTMGSLASLFGVTVGKYFMLGTEGKTITLLGLPMINNQYLLLLSTSLIAVALVFVCFLARARAREEAASR